jgi:Flp pilus assembly protein TadD
MKRAFLLPVLGCLGGLLIASGCSQGPWGWAKPEHDATADAGAGSPGGLAAMASEGKADAKMPKNPLALARLTERQGQTAQAERLYLEIAKKSPKNPAPYHRLGVMYAKQGKVPQAEEHFSRALALKPDSAELLSDAGYFYYLSGRSQEAERCLRRALELEPGNKKYCTNLALAVGEQGRRDEAYALFRRAGSETGAKANMAFVLSQRGEYQQAMDLYDRVLTDDPTMRVAADALIELSKRTSGKDKDGPSTAPGEGRPVLASHQSPATAAGNRPAAQASSSLATVSEGRPLSAAMAASRSPASPPQEIAPARANRSSSSPADTAPTVAAGVPCAYTVPADVAAPRRAEPLPPARSGLVPAPSTAGTAAASGPPESLTASAAADPHGSDSAGRPDLVSENMTPVLPGILSIRMPEPLVLTMIGGMVLMGLGAMALLRRRPRPHSPSVSYGDRTGRHRPGRVSARAGGRGVRISLRRGHA